MSPRSFLCALPLILAASACDRSRCEISSDIEPGCGVLVAGEPLRIWDTRAEMTEVHGTPERSRDLGDEGEVVVYTSLGVQGVTTQTSDGGLLRAITLSGSYDGSTARDVRIGSYSNAPLNEFGDPIEGPFFGGWYYPTQGIGFELEDDKVVRIHIFDEDFSWQ